MGLLSTPPHSVLHAESEIDQDDLLMAGSRLEENVLDDYASAGLTLRTHPMQILGSKFPLNKCKRFSDLDPLGIEDSFVSQAL
jgi:error-prone DNA polymerase